MCHVLPHLVKTSKYASIKANAAQKRKKENPKLRIVFMV